MCADRAVETSVTPGRGASPRRLHRAVPSPAKTGTSAALAAQSATLVAILLLPGGVQGSARAASISVRSEAEFAAAVSALSTSGGTIVLLPHVYRSLVVPARSGGPLRIRGSRGVRVERVLFERSQRVSLSGVTIAPVAQDAWIEVHASSHVDLDHLVVTAQGTGRSASVQVPDSGSVTIRESTFTHCGDRAPAWTNCLLLSRWARHVTIENNRFHDCFGCDFIHGRFGSDLTIRGNRFERALPCRIGRLRCGHQDLIEMFAGKRLRVIGNHFGVYRVGGAQLYLTNAIDDVVIANNVFVGTDPRVPHYRARVGVIIGSAESRRLPHYVTVANNTILTGAVRWDGYAGSIRMSSLYGGVPRRQRPIVANNVIGLLQTPARVCNAAKVSASNVVLRGSACSRSDRVGDANLDSRGRPTAASRLLRDRANRRYARTRDITGRPRGRAPDIGAYEYAGPG